MTAQPTAAVASPFECGVVVLHYLETHFPDTAEFFKRDARSLLKDLQRAPPGVKALPRILSEFVALTEERMRRRALAARDPVLGDLLALLDRAAAAPAVAPLARGVPRRQAPGQRPSQQAPRQPQQPLPRRRGTAAGGQALQWPGAPVGSAPALQPLPTPQPAAAAAPDQRPLANRSVQLRGAAPDAAPAGAAAAAGGTNPAAMRMVPTPAAAAGSQAPGARPFTPSKQQAGRAGGSAPLPAASPGQHESRKRPPARRKRPAPEPEPALEGGLEDALGILERTMNPESLLSLFLGGELQERFAAGLASHLSRSLPAQRGDGQQQQQAMQSAGASGSLPTAPISAYGEDGAASLADESLLDWSDLLTSIPTDPELISILEPLVMPPPPQPASHQAAAAQPQAAPAPQPAGGQEQPQDAPAMRPASEQPAQSPRSQSAAANRACHPLEGATAAATRPPGSIAAIAEHGTPPPLGAAASIGANSCQATTASSGQQQLLADAAAQSVSAAAPRARERGPAMQHTGSPAVSRSTSPQHAASASQPAQSGNQLAVNAAAAAEATQPPGIESAAAVDDAGVTTACNLQRAPSTAAPRQDAVEAAAADDEIMLDEQSMDSFLRELHAGQG